ncbi:MAG TPA: SelD-related putative sulfur metabolism protein [Planctomycetota bacterium]|nr:SelD-related putative sulfur metabolism protein [Planctomycetota bacterium]
MKQAQAHPLQQWKPAREDILRELKTGQKPQEMICLGCAAKVELVSTVYPVLREVSRWLREKTRIRLQPRDDVYHFETDGSIHVQRGRYKISDLVEGRAEAVARDIQSYKPDGIVVLANFTPMNPTVGRDKMKRALMGYYEAAARTNHPFTVGKGHTIQIAKSEDQEYMIVDYFKSSGSKLNGVANNDTISIIDPNLQYASWISVFVALNNALNDLFLCGVYKNLKVHPTFDARDPSDVAPIREALKRYGDRLAPCGIEIVDKEPLGFGTKSMGATVFGTTEREIPINQRLATGQWLIATRPVGDLAPLTEFLIQQVLEEDVGHLETLRMKVLETMLTPNIEAARIIESYLPRKGEAFNVDKHVTTARDMTGPGILAVEELAEDSGMKIYLDDIKLHDELVAGVDMPNPTSGTNGAIIIAAQPDVARSVTRELKEAGYSPWLMGRVEEKGDPKILINDKLQRYPFVKGIQKGIFEHYEFVKARRLA